jgi:transposase
MNISLKKRWEIIFLSKHEYGPHMSNADISRYLRIHETTVRNWLEKYETTGDVQVIQKSGRKRSTTEKQDDIIQSMVAQHPTESLGQIAFRLSKKGIQISETTLRRRFKEAGVQSMKPTSKPLLTTDHIKKRLKWALQHQDVDWNQVVFTDESSFQMKQVIRRVWIKRGEKYYVSTVKHPFKIHAWGCFSKYGFGKLLLFTQTLNSKFMCKIYKNGLLPSAKKWFGDENYNWKLLEDNDPKHMSKTSKTFKVNNDIQSLPWPLQSPDCNPIENVWSLMKLKVNRQPPTSINNFIARIKKEWKNLSIEFAEKLVDSMEKRVELLIERKGDYINY